MTSNNSWKRSILITMALVILQPLGDGLAAQDGRNPAQKPNLAVPPPSIPVGAPMGASDDGFDDAAARGTAPAANPFAGGAVGGSKGKVFDEGDDFGDEEYDEVSDDVLRQRMEERLRQKAAASGGTFDNNANPTNAAPSVSKPSNPSYTGGAVNTGMPTTAPTTVNFGLGGQLQGKGPACLRLDPDTGLGPDVVTNFDFPDADIVEIAKTLGKLTCINFILDKDVRGRISIVSNSPITVGDAWKAFLTALDVNQFTLIPSGKYLRIAKQRDAKDKQLKIYSGAYAPDNDSMITRVLTLKYINAEEVRRVFMNITAPTTRMLAYEQTNTLIITDTAANIKKLTDLISLLDIEGFDEGLEVVSIRYASAEEIAKLVDQLLPGPGGGGGIGAPPGVPRFGGKGFAQRKTKEGGVISHIIADARTNSLIINANAKGFEQVKQLIAKLDTKVSLTQGSSRIHVVYLQFADAEQVANTLNNLTAGAGTAKQPVPGAPGGGQAALFEGAVKIAADKPTNSLVVTAALSDFMLVKRVLSKLDVPRDQVYVEAVIMEMSMDKSFSLSTSIVSPKNGVGFLPDGSLQNFLLNPLTGVQGLALGFKQGNTMSFTPPGQSNAIQISNIQGLITAFQNNGNSNILATPQILTLDNQEASIEIGETVPVPSVTAVQGAGTSQSFTREKVSLALTIKPQINKISDFVKMDIMQKFADFSSRSVPKALQDQSYGTIERSSKTTVVVQNQDTVVLGGLMRDKVSETSTKVPILGDIPVLGWLFRAKTTSSSKTNLLVFITPRIIKQYASIRGILDKKLKERDNFLEGSNGGTDPYERQKLEMVRDLPALDSLKNTYKVHNSDLDGENEEEEVEIKPTGKDSTPSAFKRDDANVLPSNIPSTLQGLPNSGTETAIAPPQPGLSGNIPPGSPMNQPTLTSPEPAPVAPQ